MNRTKLKNYAPQARRDFIQAVTDRAAFLGLTAKKIEPVVEQGDVAVIGGRSFPRAVAKKRKALEDRIKAHGFDPTMEALAYTWFNRLVAIRYMELHGYFDHGYRVLSARDSSTDRTDGTDGTAIPSTSSGSVRSVSSVVNTPEILEHAEHVELPGLPRDAVIDLKLAGNKESELYRRLLVAQCNALHTAMPFLFEKLDDETELLLPDNLLHSDSLIRKLVNEIDEGDWQEVEIIGWLYQFYISERKDAVIGKVVASEDIPAATQLFTPNWIVKYLVQNTLGRQWLATYPQSALRQQMEYYIEPAEQTPEVQEQLKAITPTSLNPEELTLLDPACGSGHILVEAYDLFKAIYQERGYRAKDIPALILQSNLFGMEIDDRAAQLAAFALMMKARADDRRIFDSEAKPNILAFEDSQGMNANEIAYALNAPINKNDVPNEYLFEEIQEEKDGLFSKKALAEKGHVSQGDITALLELFENAKTFGSLIQVPPKLTAKLPEIEKRLDEVLKYGDLTHASTHVLKPLLQQARLLARRYDAVVANPPYLGTKGMTEHVKSYLKTHFPNGAKDLFAAFIIRCASFAYEHRAFGAVTPFSWMFIGSFAALRKWLLSNSTLSTLVQLEFNAFEPAMVTVCAFTGFSTQIEKHRSAFIRLVEFKGADNQSPRTLEAIRNRSCGWFFAAMPDRFLTLPDSIIAYWLSDVAIDILANAPPLRTIATPKQGLATTDNGQFVRGWYEVDVSRISFNSQDSSAATASSKRWFPFNKGGEYRKWYGNIEHVVDWENDGKRIIDNIIRKYPYLNGNPDYVAKNRSFYFREGVSWTAISCNQFACRRQPVGTVISNAGMAVFSDSETLTLVEGLLNSAVGTSFLLALSPTINFGAGDVEKVPYVSPEGKDRETVQSLVTGLEAQMRSDWDSNETSWGWTVHPFVAASNGLLGDAFHRWEQECVQRISLVRAAEEENNRIWIRTYGLEDTLTCDVADERVTARKADASEDIKRLLSYIIGCVMGRYSLDKPGLIYALSRNQGFDPSQYTTFRADDDGIIPLLETDWGIRDDAANRVVEFVSVAWSQECLEENLKFIADSLGPNNGEQPRETIRRYLATGLYKHHLSMYKKRPIYWLFSSGRQRAFQCLVYLHRYHEGTLARMRTEYVFKVQGAITSRIEQLATEITQAGSTSQRKKFEKERDWLRKQQAELLEFDEKLKHAADQRISLDLDDGVKVNYAKFGDLLAESKAITGGKDEE